MGKINFKFNPFSFKKLYKLWWTERETTKAQAGDGEEIIIAHISFLRFKEFEQNVLMVTYTKILLYQLTDIISQAWLHTQISALECGDGRSIIRNWFLLASALFSTKWLKSKQHLFNTGLLYIPTWDIHTTFYQSTKWLIHVRDRWILNFNFKRPR